MRIAIRGIWILSWIVELESSRNVKPSKQEPYARSGSSDRRTCVDLLLLSHLSVGMDVMGNQSRFSNYATTLMNQLKTLKKILIKAAISNDRSCANITWMNELNALRLGWMFGHAHERCREAGHCMSPYTGVDHDGRRQEIKGAASENIVANSTNSLSFPA